MRNRISLSGKTGLPRLNAGRYGWLPAAMVAIIFAVFVLLVYTGRKYRADPILQALSVLPFQTPFLDADTVMSALRCIRQGIDVFESNPCDPLGRVFDYSPLWLHLAVLPFTTAWIVPVGLAIDCLFIAALACLPAGQNWRQIAVILAAVLSPPVIFAMERANNDLIIFTLATILAVLSVRSLPFRLIGLACAFLAGLLKYYPMLLMAFALRERLRWFVGITIVSLLAFGLFVWLDYAPLVRALGLIPNGSYFGDMFGARTLAFGFAELWQLPTVVGRVGQAVCQLLAIGAALALRNRLAIDLGHLPVKTMSFLFAGALIVVACFNTAQNIGYRAILLILVVPAFAALAGEGERRRFWLFTTAVTIALLWAEGWRHWLDVSLGLNSIGWDTGWPSREPLQIAAWVLREACWWWVVTLLWGVIFAIAGRSRTVIDAEALFAGSAAPDLTAHDRAAAEHGSAKQLSRGGVTPQEQHRSG